MPKKNKGEYFPNLEMLSELLKPQSQQLSSGRLIEELNPTGEEDSDGEETIKDGDMFLRFSLHGYNI